MCGSLQIMAVRAHIPGGTMFENLFRLDGKVAVVTGDGAVA